MNKTWEEEFEKNIHVSSDMMTGNKYCSVNQVKGLGHGWVAPEDHQARVDELIEAKEKYTKLLYENSSLKSQLQQQALPVVPECVAKDVKRLSLSTLADWNVAVSYISKETLEWLSTTGNTNIFLGKSWTLCSLKINGFKVEKPQLFYLKHIDMSKRNSINDLYLKKYIHADLTENGEHRLSHAMSAKGMYPPKDYCAFTQQEIASMQTGSYEQIEVAE